MSRGKRRAATATRSRTSWAAVSMSRDRSNVMMTNDVPVPEIERSSVMPATVFTASSIGCVTVTSTSSGDAPYSSARTETVGKSTDG